MTGTVVSTTTHRIAGQLRFAPAHTAGITGPLAVWQILNAVAGVRHLQRIDAKLEALQRGIERLEIRSAARVYGQIFGAIETLNGLSEQYGITGTFSPDMTVKLVLAERDIRSSLAEQEFLVKRFHNTVEKIKESEGKKGAYAANQLLKEEASTFLLDAKLLTVASRASILSSEVWLRHDLEHNPTYVASRFEALTGTMDEIHNNVSPLKVLGELQTHAADCLNEMNWLSRNIFNRGLKKDIKERQIPAEKTENNSTLETKAPSVVLWKDNNSHTRSVILDVEVEPDKQPDP